MGINFTVKDIMHEISAKFVRTFLPTVPTPACSSPTLTAA
jgi:hypothetical protein